MILNLQLMSFMHLSEKLNHYKRVKQEFYEKDELFAKFLDYFDLTWIKGNYFNLKDWDYSLAIAGNKDDLDFTRSFHITNNAVESCNAILNSCMNRGKVSAESFGEILNVVVAIYEGRRNSKERKTRSEDQRSKKSDLYYFLAQESLKRRTCLLKGFLDIKNK